MNVEEAIKIIEAAIAEVEWSYPMDYTVAFEMALSALRAQAETENKPLTLEPPRGKACSTCTYYSALAEPRTRSDGAVICGYCFKDGDKDYSPNMGKGYPVFIDGGACKSYKRKRPRKLEEGNL